MDGTFASAGRWWNQRSTDHQDNRECTACCNRVVFCVFIFPIKLLWKLHPYSSSRVSFWLIGSAQRTRVNCTQHRSGAGRPGRVRQGVVQLTIHVARGQNQSHCVQRHQEDHGYIHFGHIRFRGFQGTTTTMPGSSTGSKTKRIVIYFTVHAQFHG